MRAIKAGELQATLRNRGEWAIDPGALDAWLLDRISGLPRGMPGEDAHGARQDAQPPAHPSPAEFRALEAERDGLRELVAEIKRAHAEQLDLLRARHEAQLAELRERLRTLEADRDARLAEIRADRDRWHAQATAPRGLAAWVAAVLGGR